MKNIRTANAIIIDNRDRILLVQRVKDHEEGGMWSLPGGTLKLKESIERALKREILEETGCLLTEFSFFQTRIFKNNKRIVKAHYFIGRIESEVKLNSKELTRFKWLNRFNIPKKLAYSQEKVIRDFLLR